MISIKIANDFTNLPLHNTVESVQRFHTICYQTNSKEFLFQNNETRDYVIFLPLKRDG